MTTITTVGYGDISGSTPVERVFCIVIMVVGVISFSFASGSLASIMQDYDSKNAVFNEKMKKLKKIYSDYNIPYDLYGKIKTSISINAHDEEDINRFVEDLPHHLKNEVSLYIHEDTYKSMNFLKG